MNPSGAAGSSSKLVKSTETFLLESDLLVHFSIKRPFTLWPWCAINQTGRLVNALEVLSVLCFWRQTASFPGNSASDRPDNVAAILQTALSNKELLYITLNSKTDQKITLIWIGTIRKMRFLKFYQAIISHLIYMYPISFCIAVRNETPIHESTTNSSFYNGLLSNHISLKCHI